ncbi:MAG: TonB-dependent receptor [Bacteroidales bacterium]|nr:TonB-dependent receptor [Bacteroidales bacterium]
MKYLFIFLSLCFTIELAAQENKQQTKVIRGKVYGLQADGSKQPLAGANIQWLDQHSGTVSTADGSFSLKQHPKTNIAIVSYISYASDTLDLTKKNKVEIILHLGVSIEGADIVHRQKSTQVSHFDLIGSETLGIQELGKAACCNLSESFETSPTVDVSFTDAISGQRQIRMLGLAGTYSQLSKENMPDIRGLAAINGMDFIPGTWIESIQLIKGAGSVVNGFESIAGQINTELIKPTNMDRFFLNIYANSDRSMEINSNIKIPISKKWKSALLLHGKLNKYRHDANNDGFMDMPLNSKFIVLNRYQWENTHNIHFEFGGRYSYLDQIGGQMDFDKNQKSDSLSPWGMLNHVEKIDAWAKFGKVNQARPWKSTALQVSGGSYKQNAKYGLNEYDARENSFYANFIHQNRFGSNKHVYKIGASFQYDQFNEVLNSNNYSRIESVPGIFAEYSYKPSEKIGAVLGFRTDYHNEYGLFYTPRIHIRWEAFKRTVVRASAGYGLRTANIIAEHLSVLASSRTINIHSKTAYGFGLNAETAWNYGININHSFELDYREGLISASFYRTDFDNQIVFDMDESAREVHFYNLDGKSVANSFQIQLDYEIVKRVDVRIAYRNYKVQTQYLSGELSAPLLAPHRGFFNIAYTTRKKWMFDFTVNIQGEKRVPDLSANSPKNQRPQKTPVFAIFNAQITKKWGNKFDVYLGGENLGNYRQKNPIISAENPYSPEFDASLIWAPLFGVKVYIGLRYKII